jgi:Fe-S oxidoreductase
VYGVIPGPILFSAITLIGIACFAYIVAKRLVPLARGEHDPRFDRLNVRLAKVLKYWLGQWKQPRYPTAGILHIILFAGFVVLAIRSISLVMTGIFEDFVVPGLSGYAGHIYNVVKDYAVTGVFISAAIAAIRRSVFKPERYSVPAKYGKDHTAEAVLVLALIAALMVSESLFEASEAYGWTPNGQVTESPALFSLAWIFKCALVSTSVHTLQLLHLSAYFVHEITFFFFLCFLPMGKHFHVITSLFNVYLMKLDRGSVKPAKWSIPDEKLDEVESLGVKQFEDFTWKHMLDFYSCADCGRCSDNCPANASGRPLSPRFITIKARDYCFQHYPVHGIPGESHALVGGIYSEDEIWSCTTCGACEEECPLMIEYIDKIVDMRRGMVDDGNVPRSLQKPLKALENRGNPYGKMEKNRADWTKKEDFQGTCRVRILNEKNKAETLYFVDSITSYDDRIQDIARATSRILDRFGREFGILGAMEKDSGHEVRRFGEEMLFISLRDQNIDAIKACGASEIVTADPHAYNALRNDYGGKGLPPVKHISETIAEQIRRGRIHLNPVQDPNRIYTYHDPCYLGRHNRIYDAPREVLDAIPGLKRVEMVRCRDRSFCCGGGGLMLFYEPEEEQRIGVLRVKMAAEAGADVIVTACPFCLVNMEDAIKVAGMEGKMTAIDLTELVERHLALQEQ